MSVHPPVVDTVALDLALQGGGSHGAFTWGVLDRLLDEERIDVKAVSGTSAGAVNAVALAAGLTEGGREGAKRRLESLWTEVGRLGTWFSSPLEALWLDTPLEPVASTVAEWGRVLAGPLRGIVGNATRAWATAFTGLFSPYESNPWGINPLRSLLEREIDFEAVRKCPYLDVYISATAVRSGRLRVFDRSRIDIDVVLASTCLPTLFQAVRIDGEEYWDGGYAGNPSLMPLVGNSKATDLMIVHINPVSRRQPPRSAQQILDRMNEITFNAALLKELRLLGLLQVIAPGAEAAYTDHPILARVRDLRVHRIGEGDESEEFSASSQANASLEFIRELRSYGHAQADRWLAAHRDDLGRRQTLDLASYAWS